MAEGFAWDTDAPLILGPNATGIPDRALPSSLTARGSQQSKIVVVDGNRLEVVFYEPPAAHGAPIVLLHEGLGSIALWKSYPQQLAERTARTVIAYSRYGYGNSDVLERKREPDYMHREGEVVLPALLEQLALERPVLAGHSDGASIALIYAGSRPAAVSALVLEAPHVFVEARALAGIEAARTAFLETELPRKLGRYHRDVERTFWGWNDIWLDARFRTWNIERYLPRIRVPTLVIQGDDDEYGTAAQYDAIVARVPATRVVTLSCGHAPHREREPETLAAIAQFLSDC